MSRPISAPARHGLRRAPAAPAVPPEEHWAPGWAPHPSKGPQPRHRIPQGSQGRGEHCRFRDTWLDQRIREGDYIPGPGAFRAPQDFVPPPQRRQRSRLQQRRNAKTPRPMSAPAGVAVAAATTKEAPSPPVGKDLPAPRPGFDVVDAKKLSLSRPSSQGFTKATRFGRPPPTSALTPGPGAYTQFAEFGMLPATKGPAQYLPGHGAGALPLRLGDPRPAQRRGPS